MSYPRYQAKEGKRCLLSPRNPTRETKYAPSDEAGKEINFILELNCDRITSCTVIIETTLVVPTSINFSAKDGSYSGYGLINNSLG